MVVFGSVSLKTLFDSGVKQMSGCLVQGMRHSQDVFQYVSPDVDDEEDCGSKLMKLPPHEKTTILASCREGLLCCQRMDGILSVCKPTTGQFKDLPSPGLPPWEIVSVAILVQRSSPDLSYKIVLLWTRERGNSYKCKVFDSEAWEWRDARATMYLPIGGTELIINPSQSLVIAAANSVYWLTTRDNVVEFCEANNSFHKFPVPDAVKNYGHTRLVEYKGGLGLVCVRQGDRCSELWLKDGTKNAWRKEMEVERVEEFTHPVGFLGPDIALFVSANEVIFYRVGGAGDSLVRMVPTHWSGAPNQVFPFVSDSKPVHLGPGPRP